MTVSNQSAADASPLCFLLQKPFDSVLRDPVLGAAEGGGPPVPGGGLPEKGRHPGPEGERPAPHQGVQQVWLKHTVLNISLKLNSRCFLPVCVGQESRDAVGSRAGSV